MNTRRDLAVRPVRNGRGIVALRGFRRGATVCRIRGRIVGADAVWAYWRHGNTRRGENCFRFDADRYLDPEGEIGAWANHACNPNTGIVKDARGLKLVAIRAIAAGEEVTHDYSTLLGADDVWTMRCNCGDADCRRTVRNVAKLPLAALRRYRRLGVIPRFILSTRA
ncbi:MAG: SET domain-containing protein [Burkholderiales bacterium]|nr:SET domain-containing protein [Burkholderiales bacterium]